MSISPPENSAAPPWRTSWPHIVLSLIGGALSAHAWREHLVIKAGQDPSGCTVTATIDCSSVLGSKYAVLFGMPLGAFGLLYFAFVLLTAISNDVNFSWRAFRLQQLAVAAVGFVTSIALTYISHVLIGKWCLICLRVHAVTTALFLISAWCYWQARRRNSP